MVDAGACLRAAQANRKITNLKLAEDFGVSKQQVHRWRFATDMRISRMQTFADYFGVGLHDYIDLGKQ